MKTIDEESREYANSNFENCSYHYDGDNRLTDFDKIKVAFAKGVELAQRWIPVAEELPEKYINVIIMGINGNGERSWSKGFFTINNWITDEESIVTATHWRPIELE